LKLTFVKHLKPQGKITFDPNYGDVLPCPALNCEQTQNNVRKFSEFCINWLPPSSEPDAGCSTWRYNSTEHIPV